MDDSTKMLLELVNKYGAMRGMYLDCYQHLSHIRDGMKINKYNETELVNFIYVMRDIAKFAEDLRKETNAIEQIAVNVACAIWITREQDNPIRASLATGTPNIKIAAAIPNQRREPEAFEALMGSLGVDAKAVINNTVKPHWPGIMEHISTLAEKGLPLPKGIDRDKTCTQYKMRITPYKGLDELLETLEAASIEIENIKKGEVEVAHEEILTLRKR